MAILHCPQLGARLPRATKQTHTMRPRTTHTNNTTRTMRRTRRVPAPAVLVLAMRVQSR